MGHLRRVREGSGPRYSAADFGAQSRASSRRNAVSPHPASPASVIAPTARVTRCELAWVWPIQTTASATVASATTPMVPASTEPAERGGRFRTADTSTSTLEIWPLPLLSVCGAALRASAATSRAVGRIKRAVQTGSEIPFESALAVERELQQQLFLSEDAKEGLDAYVNKRKPEFKGK